MIILTDPQNQSLTGPMSICVSITTQSLCPGDRGNISCAIPCKSLDPPFIYLHFTRTMGNSVTWKYSIKREKQSLYNSNKLRSQYLSSFPGDLIIISSTVKKKMRAAQDFCTVLYNNEMLHFLPYDQFLELSTSL